MTQRKEFIEFLGSSGALLTEVTCSGLNGSLIHRPIGVVAYNLVYANVRFALNGEELVADEGMVRKGPFVIPDHREAYFRNLLGDEDYSRSKWSRNPN